jgi:hypothetical protein
VVEVPEETLLGQLLQLIEVHDVTRFRGDLSFDRQLELVIVTVEIGIVALAERIPVPLVREPGVTETVRSIEVYAAGDGATGHVGDGYWLWAIGCWPFTNRRQPWATVMRYNLLG